MFQASLYNGDKEKDYSLVIKQLDALLQASQM